MNPTPSPSWTKVVWEFRTQGGKIYQVTFAEKEIFPLSSNYQPNIFPGRGFPVMDEDVDFAYYLNQPAVCASYCYFFRNIILDTKRLSYVY